MSYSRPRITLSDTGLTAITKMSGGNPGALTVLMHLFVEGGQIDPDDFMGGLGSVLALDTLDIYDEKIWMFYKDVCGENLESVLMLLRANQLGFLPEAELVSNVKNSNQFTTERFDELNKKVRERLPNFGKKA